MKADAAAAIAVVVAAIAVIAAVVGNVALVVSGSCPFAVELVTAFEADLCRLSLAVACTVLAQLL